MRRIRSGCCARAASGHVAAPPSSVMNARRLLIRSPRRRASRYKGISPLPVALVEGRQRAHWYPPGTTDSLVARKAKAAHQINPVVAQSKIGGRALDGFYTRDFDFRQGRCRGLGRPQRPRLLRMCCKRPCRSHAYKQAEVTSPHSITSSARASRLSGTVRPSAFAVLRLSTSSYLVGCWTGRLAGFSPLRIRSTYAAERRTMSTVFGP